MAKQSEEQIATWLKKLERESWQLELLVSAFTIFLLIQAKLTFTDYMEGFGYKYNPSNNTITFVYIFLALLRTSLMALIICLVGHLLLRGFWIGTIGLRSVQSVVDFEKFNYNDFFTEKLKKRVVSLDQLVVRFDEICSVIFASAFLVISMLLAFGLYLCCLGLLGVILKTIGEILPESLETIYGVFGLTIALIYLVSGLIYMIDFLTLGFFKRIRWFSKAYYPFYRFYSLVTLSTLSRSIYYYLIAKFTKRRIRTIYFMGGVLFLFLILVDYDQHQYFPNTDNQFLVSANCYDDSRAADEYVEYATIPSKLIESPFLELFIRYDPRDNQLMRAQCPDFAPLKEEGVNWSFRLDTEGENFVIRSIDYADEDFDQMIACQAAIYKVSVNDSLYADLDFNFYVHPTKKQKGLLTFISTEKLNAGYNLLLIEKVNEETANSANPFKLRIPFWLVKE